MTKRHIRAVAATRLQPRALPWAIWATLALGLALAAQAHAQTTTPTPIPKVIPHAAPGTDANPSVGSTGPGTGVLHPPATIDPGMTKPVPNAEAFPTPVVPPMGSPGATPGVIAK